MLIEHSLYFCFSISISSCRLSSSVKLIICKVKCW